MSYGNMTEVRLLNVPLENDYVHTLHFASVSEQTEYFMSKQVGNLRGTDFSYQRKDNIIRYPAQYDRLLGCNYVMYKNSAYSSKWYYAFITDLAYVDDGRTDISIETDVMQTWLFDYDVKSSFIEREHVNDDTYGKHTFHEGLELGEYICKNHAKVGYGGSDLAVVVGVTEDTEGKQVSGTMYNNVYSGLKYYSFHHKMTGENGIDALNTFLDSYGDGKVEAIKCMFLAPENIATVREGNTIAGKNTTDKWYVNVPDGGSINTNISFNKVIDGYSPDNNKLLCYPYRYILATNNNGASAVYNYEDFYTKPYSDNDTKTVVTPSFEIEGCLTPGCSVRMIPRNYKGASVNDEEGLNLGKFPILNWTSDYFTNWLTQNGVNIGVSALGGVISTGIGVGAILAGAMASPVTGGSSLLTGLAVAGSITSGVMGVASTIGEVTKASIVPAQSSGNLNNGDVITASGENDFHFYEMCIKGEYARIIDNYFNMYGYKVNRVGVPRTGHRQTHWYIKTIDVNIDGAIPTTDLNKIKECYNRGITFWKNAEVYGNYGLPNNTV